VLDGFDRTLQQALVSSGSDRKCDRSMTRRVASIHEYLFSAFVLDPQDLRAIHDAVSDFVDAFSYTMVCKDKISRSAQDWKVVASYENAYEQQLVSLKLQAVGERYVSLTFGDSEDSATNITIWVSGPEDALEKLVTAIRRRLTRMRPWYSTLGRINNLTSFLLVWALLLVYASVMVLSGRGHESPLPGVPGRFGADLVLIIAMSIAVIVAFIRRRLFPHTVFALGQGAKRHRWRTSVHTVVVTLLLGILGSRIASWW
jgi:hypothetical protein